MTPALLPQLPREAVPSSLLPAEPTAMAARRAHWRLAWVLVRYGHTSIALKYLKWGLRFSDRSAPHWQRLGETLASLGDDGAAIVCYQRALRVIPDQAWTHYHLAKALDRQGRLDESISHLRRFSDLNPDFFWGHQDLGEALARQGRYAAALSCYEAAQRADPTQARAYHYQGDALLHSQQYEQAIACYQAAIERNASFAWSHYNLGNALAQLGRWSEAAAAFKQAVSLATAKNRDLMLKKQMWALDRAYSTNPSQSKKAYFESLDPRQHNNLRACFALLETRPDHRDTYVQLVKLLTKQGKPEQAIAYANIALQLDPNHKEARTLRDRLLVRERIPGIPADFKMPPIVGENNDYSFIEDQMRAWVASGQAFTKPISIVIPTYNRRDRLAKTLAAITHQTYPKDLIEVVVADDGGSDGTDELVEAYKPYLNIKYVWHEDRGYRIAATYNLGVRHASHDSLMLLNSDMMPLPGAVAAYMRYLHASDRGVLIGHRRFVEANHLNDDQIRQQPEALVSLPDIKSNNALWVEDGSAVTLDYRLNLYDQTNYLKEEMYPFRAFVTCNVALSRHWFEAIGGFDEDFDRWGREDNEFGYRLYNEGLYFIPVIEAIALHQEPANATAASEAYRIDDMAYTTELLEQKCPAPLYRPYRPGKTYEVPKVSIYIPAYNAEAYLGQAIDSVLNQTYQDLEICVVDDGSTDRTVDVLKSYQHEPRVRWQSQTNGGIGSASNAAVKMCRGMYIGQLDADDTLEPDAVETLVRYLDSHPIGCAYGTRRMIDRDGNPCGLAFNWPTFSREKFLLTMIVHHFRMYRRRDYRRTSGFLEDLKNAVDYDFFLKLSEVCTLVHVDKVIYNYRWHGKNTSIEDKTAMDTNDRIVVQRSLERLGLADEWELFSPDPADPRRKVLRRKGFAS